MTCFNIDTFEGSKPVSVKRQHEQGGSSEFSFCVPTPCKINDTVNLEPVVKKRRGRPPRSAYWHAPTVQTGNVSRPDTTIENRTTSHSFQEYSKTKKVLNVVLKKTKERLERRMERK